MMSMEILNNDLPENGTETVSLARLLSGHNTVKKEVSMNKQEIREIEQRCIEEEKNLVFDSFSQTEALKLGGFIYEKK